MFVLDAANEFGEFQTLNVEVAVEFLGDALDIEGVLEAAGYFRERDISLRVEFANVHDERGELAQEQIAGLAFDVEMVAGMGFAGLALDPIPEALRARGIGEDEKILRRERRDGGVNGRAAFGVGNRAARRGDFKDVNAGEHRHGCAVELDTAFGLGVSRLERKGRIVPTEFVDEQLAEVKVLKVLARGLEIQRHGVNQHGVQAGRLSAGAEAARNRRG